MPISNQLSRVGFLPEYTDSNQIAPWAIDAGLWLRDSGLIEHGSDVQFRPNEAATRAEVASLFARLMENIQ